jgi:lipoprotein NlpD
LLLITACSQQTRLPPVVELKWHANNMKQSQHRVKRGETLYSIAFRYDKDYRLLADYNHLRSPYVLHVGQIIYLQYLTKGSHQYYAPVRTVRADVPVRKQIAKKTEFYHPVVVTPVRRHSSGQWVWPATGRVVANFIPEQGKKGIDIAGKKGGEVRAAASGVVAYSGSGLSGYGNLIIIKHDGQFLTAYGNNFRNRVVEGQRVKVGQIIAEMGIVDRKFWGVHFEIRKAGQPVNPMNYLQ